MIEIILLSSQAEVAVAVCADVKSKMLSVFLMFGFLKQHYSCLVRVY